MILYAVYIISSYNARPSTTLVSAAADADGRRAACPVPTTIIEMVTSDTVQCCRGTVCEGPLWRAVDAEAAQRRSAPRRPPPSVRLLEDARLRVPSRATFDVIAQDWDRISKI